MGYPVYGIAARHKDAQIDKFFEKRRLAHGLQVIPLEAGSLRACYKVLKEKKVLALNADRLFGEDGIEVDFLGRRVLFPRGIGRLSEITGAPVVPAFLIRTGYDRYLLEVERPIFPRGDEKETVHDFVRVFEDKVRRHPTQWFIFQPFWKQPEWPI
jgi:KDO2-lipid IV(A) lauroyltransferase